MADATYTVVEDYYEQLSDGSGRKKLFSAGQQIAWETAYAVGLVKTKHAPSGFQVVTEPGGKPLKTESTGTK